MKYIEKQILQQIVNESQSKTECLGKLGLHTTSSNSYRILNYYLDIYDIDTSSYKGYGDSSIKMMIKTIPLEDIFNGLHPLYQTNSLKKRIIKEQIFPNKCNRCDLSEWMGARIPLQLDHKDGNPTNHKIDNLELLCPNCHAMTSTYCGKNTIQASIGKIKLENKKQREKNFKEKQSHKIDLIESSDIDFTAHGWVSNVAVLLNMKPQKINAWVMRYMPKFYEDKCFKRKKPSQ